MANISKDKVSPRATRSIGLSNCIWKDKVILAAPFLKASEEGYG